ncbi:MAG: molybdopterin-guanine dinucleotide biosynthesis protein B [Synergistaceae bacterium]|nr:molybdopterin-guanine dinucleotide biosynthesis protein B [Synergistaceae bacterium]
MIPIFSITAWSGAGKTTFIEHLIPELKRRNLRTAVIKHDAHDFDIDKEGKDTFRFTQAGAEIVSITSRTHAAFMENRYVPLAEILRYIHDVDVIIVEGFKNENIPKIGLRRGNFLLPEGEYIAVISDVPMPESEVPVFDVNDYNGFSEWLANELRNWKHGTALLK